MTDNISILITGNPDANSGFTDIGSVGSGLSAFDPEWPRNAKSKFVFLISQSGRFTRYCLMLDPALISSTGANRSGVFNIQTLLPSGHVIVAEEGQTVSPFTFMRNLFQAYEKLHLKKYPGVEGWNFSANARMTPEEFDTFMQGYRVEKRKLPSRPLTGTAEATIVLPMEKIEQISLDHAYPQLTEFNQLVLCTEGLTMPPELASLEIPRKPEFEIYVNGRKQDCVIRPNDPAFDYTVSSTEAHKEPTVINVSFEDGDNKMIDYENERIDYTVSFKDEVIERTVSVKLSGCEGNQNLYTQLLSEILKSLKLTCDYPGAFAPKVTDPKAKSATFTIQGAAIDYEWKPVCTSLPQNVGEPDCTPTSSGWTLYFNYNKPVEKPKPAPEVKKATPAPTVMTIPPVTEIQVYVTAADEADTKLTEKCRDLTFNLELSEYASEPAITYVGIATNGSPVEINCTLNGNDKRLCYESKVKVPTVYMAGLENKNRKVVVECTDARFEASGLFVKPAEDKNAPGFIRVYVTRRNPIARFVGPAQALGLLVGLVLFCCGCWFGESLTPWAKITGKEKPKTERVDYIDEQQEDLPDVDEDAPDEEITDTDDNPIEPPQDANDNAESVENPTKPIEPQESVSAPNVDNQALQQQAKGYLAKIVAADLSFNEVDEINKWIAANIPNSGPIKGFNRIREAIPAFTQCKDIIRQITPDADLSGITPKIKTIVSKLPDGEDCKQLRIKMQQFTLKGKTLLKDDEIDARLYDFTEKHPNGISSFNDL